VTPAPTLNHQRAIARLHLLLAEYWIVDLDARVIERSTWHSEAVDVPLKDFQDQERSFGTLVRYTFDIRKRGDHLAAPLTRDEAMGGIMRISTALAKATHVALHASFRVFHLRSAVGARPDVCLGAVRESELQLHLRPGGSRGAQ